MNDKARPTQPRKTVVAVEIGQEWLKIVQAERDGARAVQVSRLCMRPVKEDQPGLHEEIRTVWRDQRLARLPVMVSLPRQLATMRTLKLPSTGLIEWMSAAGIDPANGRGVMLVDVDSLCTDVVVSVNDKALFARSIRIGARHIEEDYARWVERFGAALLIDRFAAASVVRAVKAFNAAIDEQEGRGRKTEARFA